MWMGFFFKRMVIKIIQKSITKTTGCIFIKVVHTVGPNIYG